jgi:hypothetical protein
VQHFSANPPYSIPLYCSDVDSELADHEDDGDNFVVRFARNHLSLPDKWSHLLGVPRSAYDSGHETGRIHGSHGAGLGVDETELGSAVQRQVTGCLSDPVDDHRVDGARRRVNAHCRVERPVLRHRR